MNIIVRCALGVTLLVATACSQSGPVAQPKEGDIVVYSGREEALVGDLFDAFTTATGIKVSVKYGETSELAATIAEEGDASPADVFWAQDAGALGAIESEGLFASLPASITNEVDDRYRSPKDHWVGVSGRLRVIGYSTDRVEANEVPSTVDGLTSPEWKGKVGWAPTNGSFHAFITAMRLTEGEDATKAWLEEMIANEAVAYPKNSATVTAIDAGEVDLGLINHYYPLQVATEQPDLAVASSFPEGIGGLANVAGVGILANSDNAADAEAFVEYLLGDAAQTYFVERSFEYPLVDGIEPHESLPKLDSLDLPDVALSELTDLEGTLDLLAEVGLL